MSETVHYKGRLKKIEVEDIKSFKKEAVENYFKIAPKPNWYKDGDYEEFFDDDLSEIYCQANGCIYQILSQDELDDYEDIFLANSNSDGTIDYQVKYYNGGCGFSEALETAINIMENKNV